MSIAPGFAWEKGMHNTVLAHTRISPRIDKKERVKMTFGLKAFNLLDAARACPNYVLGLGNTGHGCKLDGDHCKLFRGLPCGPFKRMNPNLFQPTLGSTESNP